MTEQSGFRTRSASGSSNRSAPNRSSAPSPRGSFGLSGRQASESGSRAAPVECGSSGSVRKGWGSAPSAERVRAILKADSNGNGAETLQHHAAERIGGRGGPAAPLLCGLFVLGPGTRRIRELLADYAPYLDKESGELLQWLILADPRQSGAAFLAFLEHRGIPSDGLAAEWRALIEARGNADAVVAFETESLASTYGVAVEEMPVLLLFVDGQNDEPMRLRLPRAARSSEEACRTLVSELREHLGSGPLRSIAERFKRVNRRQARHELVTRILRIEKRLRRLDAARPEVTANRQKRFDAFRLVEAGATVLEAARIAEVSTSALYADPIVGPMIKGLIAKRRARGSPAHGNKHDGRVEAFTADNVVDDEFDA